MNNTDKAQMMHDLNARRLQTFASKGYEIQGETLAALDQKIKFDSLYETLVPQDQKTKDKLKFEEIVSSQLDSIEQQIEMHESQQRQQSLLHGVPLNGHGKL